MAQALEFKNEKPDEGSNPKKVLPGVVTAKAESFPVAAAPRLGRTSPPPMDPQQVFNDPDETEKSVFDLKMKTKGFFVKTDPLFADVLSMPMAMSAQEKLDAEAEAKPEAE